MSFETFNDLYFFIIAIPSMIFWLWTMFGFAKAVFKSSGGNLFSVDRKDSRYKEAVKTVIKRFFIIGLCWLLSLPLFAGLTYLFYGSK